MKKLGVINLGSTSTKVAYFEDDVCVFSDSISHPAEEIKQFATNWDQYDYRKKRIVDFLKAKAWTSQSWTPSSAGAATPNPSTAACGASTRRCWRNPAA